MKHHMIWFLLAVVFLGACAPAVQPQAATPVDVADFPRPMATATEAPAPVYSPTPAPVKLPVDRFTAPPALAELTLQNVANVKQVASFSASKITAIISSDGSLLTLQAAAGAQTYRLPDLTPALWLPLRLSFFSPINAISPDGRYLARAYQAADHPLKPIISVFDLEAGKEICKIDSLGVVTDSNLKFQIYPEQNFFALSGSLAGSMSGNKGQAFFWKLDTCRQFLEVKSDFFFAPPISADGRYTAVIKGEKVVVFDLQKNSQKTLTAEVGRVQGIGFLPASGEIALATRARTFIYNLASEENTATFDANISNYLAELVSIHNGEWLLVKAGDKNYLWNSAQNKTYGVGEHFGSEFNFEQGILQTSYALFNVSTGSKISLEQYGYQPSSALSEDGLYFAISSRLPPFFTDVYETTSGKKIATINDVHTPLAASPQTFVVSGDGQIQVVQFSTGATTQTIAGMYTGGISRAGQVIVWNDLGEIAILDVEAGSFNSKSVLPFFPLGATQYLQHQNSVPAWEAVLGGFDGSLAALGEDFSVETLAVSSGRTMAIQEGAGQLIQVYQGSAGGVYPASSRVLAATQNKPFGALFKFSPDDAIIAGASNQLILWDGATGAEIKRFALQIGATMDLNFSPDGTKLALSGNTNGGQVNVFGDLTLMVFDIPGKKLLHRYEMKQQLRKVGCNVTLPFAFTPDSKQIFTLTPECRIGVYELENFKEVNVFGSPYAGYALSFGLSPDGKILAVGLAKRLELWDVMTGKLIKKFDIPQLAGNYDNYYHRIVFAPDGRAIIVKSGVSFANASVVTVWGVPETP